MGVYGGYTIELVVPEPTDIPRVRRLSENYLGINLHRKGQALEAECFDKVDVEWDERFRLFAHAIKAVATGTLYLCIENPGDPDEWTWHLDNGAVSVTEKHVEYRTREEVLTETVGLPTLPELHTVRVVGEVALKADGVDGSVLARLGRGHDIPGYVSHDLEVDGSVTYHVDMAEEGFDSNLRTPSEVIEGFATLLRHHVPETLNPQTSYAITDNPTT